MGGQVRAPGEPVWRVVMEGVIAGGICGEAGDVFVAL